MSEIDAATHRVRVTFPDRDDLESPWLDVLVEAVREDKRYGLPAVGSQVAVLLDEAEVNGCVLGAVYSDEDAPPDESSETARGMRFGDGCVIEYDVESHTFRVMLPGDGTAQFGDPDDSVARSSVSDDRFDALEQALNDFVTAFNAHTHVAPMGGTTPPASPAQPVEPGSSTSSSILKVQS